jgi:S1-C subfamily serine protease
MGVVSWVRRVVENRYVWITLVLLLFAAVEFGGRFLPGNELIHSAGAILQLDQATVMVRPDDGGSSGSGVTFNRGGQAFVLTAAHVVEDCVLETNGIYRFKPVEVLIGIKDTGSTVGQQVYKADIVAYSDSEDGEDIAILRVRKYGEWPVGVQFNQQEVVPIGTRLFHVGCLYGLDGQNSFSDGTLSQTGRISRGKEFDQSSCFVFPGSSGGGIFDSEGRYVGLVTRWRGPGINLFVPMRRILAWARQYNLEWVFDPDLPVPPEAIRKAEIGPTQFNW